MYVCMYICIVSAQISALCCERTPGDPHAAFPPFPSFLPHPRMVPPPWVVGGRPRRSGAARRAQTVRAHARAAQRLIQGFAALHHHRGCQPTELGAALAVVLIRQTCAPPSTPTPAPPPRADAAPLAGAADPPEARCAGSAAGAPELGAATPPAPAPRRAAYAPTTPSTPELPPRADAAPPEARATDAPPTRAAAALPRADAAPPPEARATDAAAQRHRRAAPRRRADSDLYAPADGLGRKPLCFPRGRGCQRGLPQGRGQLPLQGRAVR
jgi:hypothetical protein